MMKGRGIFYVVVAVILAGALLFANDSIKERLINASVDGALFGGFLVIAASLIGFVVRIFWRGRKTPEQRELDRRATLGYETVRESAVTQDAKTQDSLPTKLKAPKDVRLMIAASVMWIFLVWAWGYIWEWDGVFSDEQYTALFLLPVFGLWLGFFFWRWIRS